MDKKQQAISKAQEYISKLNSSTHNRVHIQGVVKYALELCSILNTNTTTQNNNNSNYEFNNDVVEIAAWWHDVARLYDKTHEERSAVMAKQFCLEIRYNKEFSEKVFNAIELHKYSMRPKTIEGKIVRDADKLDFLSINRWKECLKDNNIKPLENWSKMIPILKNEIYDLEETKRIHDRDLPKLIEFIKKEDKLKNNTTIKKLISI